MNLIFLLIAVAILSVLFVCLALPYLKHNSAPWHFRSRRYRPLSRMERIALPFVLAMHSLSLWWNRNFTWHGGNRLALGNAALTMRGDSDSKLADEAIGRYQLVKPGSDVDHVGLCDKGDIPLGFTRESSASGAEVMVAFDYLGLAHKGSLGTASGAITAGNLLCPGDNGTLRDITQVAGETVYVCGRAVTTAANAGAVSWIPYSPVKLIIA